VTADAEIQRVRDAYARRRTGGLHGPLRPDKIAESAGRSAAWCGPLLRSVHGLGTVVEVGAGVGQNLRWAREMGAMRVAGVDLLADRAAEATRRGTLVLVADGRSLPFASGAADSVIASTLFSSVLAPADRRRVAGEIARVLRPGGALLFYDFDRPSPSNRDVRPVTRREVRELFPGWPATFRRTTLAPPVARRLLWHPAVRTLLELVPLLRTHLAAVLVRPAGDPG
jgi:SAM-dependent methyltransferase